MPERTGVHRRFACDGLCANSWARLPSMSRDLAQRRRPALFPNVKRDMNRWEVRDRPVVSRVESLENALYVADLVSVDQDRQADRRRSPTSRESSGHLIDESL